MTTYYLSDHCEIRALEVLNRVWTECRGHAREQGTLQRAFEYLHQGSALAYWAWYNGNYDPHYPARLQSASVWAFDSKRDVDKCSQCGDVLAELGDGERELQDYELYCIDCLDEHFHQCSQCSDRVPVDDSYCLADETYCESCYRANSWECTACNDRFHNDVDSTRVDGGDYVCNHCYENGEYFTCESCEHSFSGDCCYDEHNERTLCESCYSDRRRSRSGLIQEYSHGVSLSKFGSPKDGIYFGIELEVQSESGDRDESAQVTKSRLGSDFVVLKEDSSIGDDGYEIVTAPATLEAHREHWDRFFARPPSDTYSWKSGKCGMHVHVSRRPLSQLTICKIGAFLHENKAFTESVAGRDCDRWAKVYKKSKRSDYRHEGDRYEALNLQNGATIEFRIFRGTMKRESFYKNLEFVHALVYYCKGSESGLAKLTPNDFAKYVRANRKLYPNLDNWLVTRRLLPLVPVCKVTLAGALPVAVSVAVSEGAY